MDSHLIPPTLPSPTHPRCVDQEQLLGGLQRHLWAPLLPHRTDVWYSPLLGYFANSAPPDVRGGFMCEEMVRRVGCDGSCVCVCACVTYSVYVCMYVHVLYCHLLRGRL